MADDKKTDENEAVAVTGRPNDIPIRDAEPAPLGGNSTFADRAKANAAEAKKAQTKQVAAAENKSVDSAESKTAARKAARSTKKG